MALVNENIMDREHIGVTQNWKITFHITFHDGTMIYTAIRR